MDSAFDKYLPLLFSGINLSSNEIDEIQKKRNVSKRATETFGKR
jgi:hypothetical protein